MACVRIPLETYIFILNFSIPACSEQLSRSHANDIKHSNSPVVIFVLDPRYDSSYKALFEESGLNNWSTNKSHNGGRNQVSGRVSVPCWHATPVANAPCKPLIIGEGQSRYQGREIGGKSDLLGGHCWSRIRMSFNIRERDTSYCWIRSPYRP